MPLSAADVAEAKAARKQARKAGRKAERQLKQHGEVRRPLPSGGGGCASLQPNPKRAKHAPTDAADQDAAAAAGRAYLLANEITIHDARAPPPCLELRSAPFVAALVQILRAQKGFTAPSAVQASSWPVAVSGRDVLAIAKTGSGKTLGFLLPVLTRCHREKAAGKTGSPIALIMAPTRELGENDQRSPTRTPTLLCHMNHCRLIADRGSFQRCKSTPKPSNSASRSAAAPSPSMAAHRKIGRSRPSAGAASLSSARRAGSRTCWTHVVAGMTRHVAWPE